MAPAEPGTLTAAFRSSIVYTMLTADDYLDVTFGWFKIVEPVGSGAEAEVFRCTHLATGRSYVVRLSISDDETWERESPQIPPCNSTLEHDAARGAALLSEGSYSSAIDDRIAPNVLVAQLYGVLEQRYLMPLSNVYKRRGACPFDSLLTRPPEFMSILPFWENLSLLLTSEASLLADGTIPFEEWTARWQDLVSRSRLGLHLQANLGKDLPLGVETRIREMIEGDERPPGPVFEESATLRMITAVTGGAVTLGQLQASLRCPFFRMNVTTQDLDYAVALWRLCQPVAWLPQGGISWLGPSVRALPTILQGLAEQPDSFPTDIDAFESCAAPDDATLQSYSLLVQDFAGSRQSYLALERVGSDSN